MDFVPKFKIFAAFLIAILVPLNIRIYYSFWAMWTKEPNVVKF